MRLKANPKKTEAPKLQPQLVPSPLWGINAHKLLGRGSAWKRIRSDALEASGHRCEICGETPSPIYGDPLICLELWRYDDNRATATLIGFEIHCSACDKATHMGRAMEVGQGDA